MSTSQRMQVYAALGQSLEIMGMTPERRDLLEAALLRVITRASALTAHQLETLPDGGEVCAYQHENSIYWTFEGGDYDGCLCNVRGKVTL